MGDKRTREDTAGSATGDVPGGAADASVAVVAKDLSEWLAMSIRGARVLIVDDDRLQCKHLAATFEGWSATVFTAQTLSDALRLYRDCSPDLVMLDVLMPMVDGYKGISEASARTGARSPRNVALRRSVSSSFRGRQNRLPF